MKKTYEINHNHPFHLVTPSPWPLLVSLSLFFTAIGLIMWIFEFNMNLFKIASLCIMLNSTQWWRDVIRESTFQGCHTKEVIKLLNISMLLFITSEILFFFSFFWTLFHMSLSPDLQLGMNWPPKNIIQFNPYNIPLLNTIILLSSGISITWSHHCILNNNYKQGLKSLKITIILGLYFTYLQYIEYKEAPFTMNDSVYGSIFFLMTGFHGAHVIIGTIFIFISMKRLKKLQFSNYHHFGFEASAWYWHFVDVIWLFVYIFLYWWNF